MRFPPDKTPCFFTKETYREKITSLYDELALYRREGTVRTVCGVNLYYEYFLAGDAKATVVVVQGLSEFTKKYYEFTRCLVGMGYNVFLYDHRCHGMSDRLTDDIQLLHVDSFFDYVRDLELMIGIAKKIDDVPIYIYAHSMGGAVSAIHLANKRCIVKKAVLTAPMICPVIGVPHLPVQGYLKLLKRKNGGASRLARSKDFNPEHPFKNTSDASYERFCHNLGMRRQNERYQTTPMSVGWTLEALRAKRLVLGLADMITAPVLLQTPANDRVVQLAPQYTFAKKCRTCTHQIINNAGHSMLTCNDETVHNHIMSVLEFYDSESSI